ncbi:DnaJ C-terminal domain-containing protein [Oricola cellulosilytica]|uniref:J domain-containing protein n=1 Tax=Oricola cellulosilytica TaxID=1429082 RepID=A0A4R0P8P9_9HYPH|nr:DnaJ C-terminal domain-containing protein [Oricola cellulosilytica]TCD13454.1 J domain-containing protein [Oricola cellulosilytica]
MRDPYTVLGVAKTASASDIKSAYRKLAKKHHPDSNKNDPKAQERFSEVSRAYEILGDEKKRKQFDRGEIDAEGREAFHGYQRGNPFTGYDGFDEAEGVRGFQFRSRAGGAEDILSELFGSAFGGARRAGGAFAGMDGGPAGAARANASAKPARGKDIEADLVVGVTDLLSGQKARLKLPDGRTVAVSVPKGAVDGQVIRLKGQGMPGPAGHRGDVLATLRIRPSDGMRLSGSDLFVDVDVPLETAIGGGKVSLALPDGKKVALTVPAWASSGQTLRLKGKGLPNAKGGHGDLFAVLLIQLPDEKREALEALFKKTEV